MDAEGSSSVAGGVEAGVRETKDSLVADLACCSGTPGERSHVCTHEEIQSLLLSHFAFVIIQFAYSA